MKLPVGFPYFDKPHVQKVTQKEQGLYFVPTKGVDEEWASKDSFLHDTKAGKIIKTVGIVLAVAVFAGLLIWFILDPGPVPKIMP